MRALSGIAAPAFSARLPSTLTSPARIIACAFWRDSAIPRSTTRTSSRLRVDLTVMTRSLLGSPEHEEFRDGSQSLGPCAVRLELDNGFRRQIVRNLVRAPQPKNGWVSRLLLGDIFSGR